MQQVTFLLREGTRAHESADLVAVGPTGDQCQSILEIRSCHSLWALEPSIIISGSSCEMVDDAGMMRT